MIVHDLIRKVADYVKMGPVNDNDNGESKQKSSSIPTLPLPHQRSISTLAAPGLMTLIDTALFRANEGQITSTICSANATLCAVLELKRQASLLLHAIQQAQGPSVFSSKEMPAGSSSSSRNKNNNSKNQKNHQKVWSTHVERLSSLEQYAKHVLECANAAINRIVTDHLSASANLTLDPNEDSLSSQDVNARPLPSKNINDKPNNESPKQTQQQQQDAQEMLILQTILKSATPTQTQLQLMSRSTSLTRALRRKSSWEDSTLHCPDYVWADSVQTHCTRLLRSLQKGGLAQFQAIHEWQNDDQTFRSHNDHDSLTSTQQLDSECILAYNNVQNLVNIDLPLRLQQFRKAMEGDAVVLKRLYLVKCEVRAPFRCFWEGHVKVQKLPDLDLVTRYLNHDKSDSNGNLKRLPQKLNVKSMDEGGRKEAEMRIQECIQSKPLLKALEMEMERERIEMDISKSLLPFCELSKVLGVESGSTNKNLFWVVPIPGVLEGNDRKIVFEFLRRLRGVSWSANNAAVGGGLSANAPVGIRPLLMDLQGIPREQSNLVCELDPFKPQRSDKNKNVIDERLATFCSYLKVIYDLASKTKSGGSGSGFYTDKRDSDLGIAAKECSNFDANKFQSNIKEWFALSKQQRDISLGRDEILDSDSKEDVSDVTSSPKKGFKELAEELRQSEIEVTIGMASKLQLQLVRDRIEEIEKDRMKRFQVLQEMVQDVCFREMDFHLKLTAPEKNLALELPELKSARGVFGPALEISGEIMSSG